MAKDNQTTISYGAEIDEWISNYTDERECSKAAAVRYCIRQQIQREQTNE